MGETKLTIRGQYPFYESPFEEPQFPGVNDLMSGAVHPGDNGVNSSNIQQLEQVRQSDRTTVSESKWAAMIEQMPYKVISRRWISKAFSNPDSASRLDKNFYTTVWGFERALKEAADHINSPDYDDSLFKGLMKRGGLLPKGERP